jgi:uncharacterized protein YbjT (DUF2867 family)
LRVLLVGATGLVGRLLCSRLIKDERISAIDIVGRRSFGHASGKVTEHVAPVEEWPFLISRTLPDIGISTLGTTIRDAGSQGAFSALDFDAVIAVGRACAAARAQHFMAVSSAGAHARSRNFYLATKGKVEAEIAQIGFDRVDIFRPGLLRGKREGNMRIGEELGRLFSPLTDFFTPAVLDYYRSIAAVEVAAAMHGFVSETQAGVFTHDNRAMLASCAARAS